MAIGQLDGSIQLFTSKNMTNSEINSKTFSQIENSAILCLKFALEKQPNKQHKWNLFYTTKNLICCLQNLQNKKQLFQQGAQMCQVNKYSQNFYASISDKDISEFNTLQKVNSFNYEVDKKNEGERKFFDLYGKNYNIIVTHVKNGKIPFYSLIIYDSLNCYIAFQTQYSEIQKIIVADSKIMVIILNNKGEKQLVQLCEKDNQLKMKSFFNKSFYDIALQFAKNLGSNNIFYLYIQSDKLNQLIFIISKLILQNQYPLKIQLYLNLYSGVDSQLLCEISKLHGDHLYNKGDYQKAIEHYSLTIGQVEPSYVIRKFLDVSQIENLIYYLQNIHDKKLADKHHTALLLNCYVKQKSIDKLQTFIKKSSFDSELFDTETAIQVCRELNKNELALQLAEQSKHDQLYLKILIEDQKKFDAAISHIREKLELRNKIKYMREFGAQLLQANPDKFLNLLKYLILLSTYQKENLKFNTLDSTRRDVVTYLHVENELDSLQDVQFPKPDDFLHIFVDKKSELKQYLEFLKNQSHCDKIIYHRLFEYYLQEFKEIFNQNRERLQHRETYDQSFQAIDQQIEPLLTQTKKYDANHVMILFKMYQYNYGIVKLLERSGNIEELLQFYIDKQIHDKIVYICKTNGERNPNLWIQALKYFVKPENGDNYKMIEEILSYVSKIDVLTPQMILQILSKQNKIQFKYLKLFFINKIQNDVQDIKRDQQKVKENRERAQEARDQFKKLKTQGKIFQSNKCQECEKQLTIPSIHFMCGHSFHDNCLFVEKNEKECSKCSYELNKFLETKENFESFSPEANLTKFGKDSTDSIDKFEIIAKFLGRSIFKNNQNN